MLKGDVDRGSVKADISKSTCLGNYGHADGFPIIPLIFPVVTWKKEKELLRKNQIAILGVKIHLKDREFLVDENWSGLLMDRKRLVKLSIFDS